eukprot:UN03352
MTTSNNNSIMSSSALQTQKSFQQRIMNRPLEFDIDWSSVEYFEASIAYDILIKPLLSQKRTLRQIFFERKIYREEDDDNYDPIKHKKDDPNRQLDHKVNTLYNITQFNQNNPQQLPLSSTSTSSNWSEIVTSNTLQHFTNYTQHIAQV